MRWIRASDVFHLAVLAGLLPISWLVPARHWPRISRWLAILNIRVLGNRLGSGPERIKAELARDPRELELEFRQRGYWELIELLREHAPGGWTVPISLSGKQHLDDALAAGKGAILWYCPFLHGDILFKRGLCEAGYGLSHLSALTHGFSDTRFGLHVLNPVKTAVEMRYVKERLVLDGKDARPTLSALRNRLLANGLVSITAVHTGKRAAYRPLFGGELRLATGGPHQAVRTGAALLPLFVVPQDGGYQLRVEAPLLHKVSKEEVTEDDYVSAYIPILERYIRSYPALWKGWFAGPMHWRYEPNKNGRESSLRMATSP